MMFSVKCLDCGERLGECSNLLAMATLVMPHSCKCWQIKVTCLQCREELITGPAIWEDASKGAKHDIVWEELHQHLKEQ